LAEAALANTQFAVVSAVMQAKFSREGTTVEEAAVETEQTVGKRATQLVVGWMPAATKARQRRGKLEAKVVYSRSIFEVEENGGKVVLPDAQPV